jgi:hypothetical protein
MLGISWTEFRTNVSILKELRIKQRLPTLVKTRILSFFGHVSRRNNDSIERLVVQGRANGKRPRKRPPMRWTDQIKSAMKGPLNAFARMAPNREKWREIVRQATSAPDISSWPRRSAKSTTTKKKKTYHICLKFGLLVHTQGIVSS